MWLVFFVFFSCISLWPNVSGGLRLEALYRLQQPSYLQSLHLFYWTACYYRLNWLFSPCPQGVAISCYVILAACVGQLSCWVSMEWYLEFMGTFKVTLHQLFLIKGS